MFEHSVILDYDNLEVGASKIYNWLGINVGAQGVEWMGGTLWEFKEHAKRITFRDSRDMVMFKLTFSESMLDETQVTLRPPPPPAPPPGLNPRTYR